MAALKSCNRLSVHLLDRRDSLSTSLSPHTAPQHHPTARDSRLSQRVICVSHCDTSGASHRLGHSPHHAGRRTPAQESEYDTIGRVSTTLGILSYMTHSTEAADERGPLLLK